MKRHGIVLLLAFTAWAFCANETSAAAIYYSGMYQDDFPSLQLQGGGYNLYSIDFTTKSVPGDFQSGKLLTQFDLLPRDPATIPGYGGPYSPDQTISLEGIGHYRFNFYSDKLDSYGQPQSIAQLNFAIAIHGSAHAPIDHWFQGVVNGVGTDASLTLFPADLFSDRRRPEWSTGTPMPADLLTVNQGIPASLIDLVAHPERIQFSGHVSGATANNLLTTVSIAPPGDLSAYALPEPATLTTLLVGFSGIILAQWRRRVTHRERLGPPLR